MDAACRRHQVKNEWGMRHSIALPRESKYFLGFLDQLRVWKLAGAAHRQPGAN